MSPEADCWGQTPPDSSWYTDIRQGTRGLWGISHCPALLRWGYLQHTPDIQNGERWEKLLMRAMTWIRFSTLTMKCIATCLQHLKTCPHNQHAKIQPTKATLWGMAGSIRIKEKQVSHIERALRKHGDFLWANPCFQFPNKWTRSNGFILAVADILSKLAPKHHVCMLLWILSLRSKFASIMWLERWSHISPGGLLLGKNTNQDIICSLGNGLLSST